MMTHEAVIGSAGGVTEVRGSSKLLPGRSIAREDGAPEKGAWQPGREVTYKQDPAAKVVFK